MAKGVLNIIFPWHEHPFVDWLRTGTYKIDDTDLDEIDNQNGLVISLMKDKYSLEVNAYDEDWNYLGCGKLSGKLNLELVFCFPSRHVEGDDVLSEIINHDEETLAEEFNYDILKKDDWEEALLEYMSDLLEKCINKKCAFSKKHACKMEKNKMNTNVVLVSGRAQHGKDTFAGIMRDLLEKEEKKTLIIHYADLLKFICTKFFGWNGEKDDAGRALLQTVGTDVIRAKDPDYWVNFVIKTLGFFNDEFAYVVVPDLRFPNEYDRMFEAGYDVTHVHVVRPDFDNGLTEEQKKHPSENDMGNYNVDYTVVNDGDIEALTRKAKTIVEDLIR